MRKVMLYSGGLDSYLLAKNVPADVYVFMDYGQTNRECEFAWSTCPGVLIKVPVLVSRGSPAETIYARQLTFIAALCARDIVKGGDVVLSGAHAGPSLTKQLLARFPSAPFHPEHYLRNVATLNKYLSAVAGIRCLYPHGKTKLRDLLLSHRQAFPPLQPCNDGVGVNCRKCAKCVTIAHTFRTCGMSPQWRNVCAR